MASANPGQVALNGVDYAIVENTYTKQTQQPFNARFSTGDPSLGDLSFFQFVSMEDFSGGNGQEILEITNRFFDSDGIDVSTPGELKLAPKIEFVAAVNGPQHEHLNEPVEDEDAWPQVIEWLGQAVIFNDRIEFDAGGVDFLSVFETDITKDKVINHDTSGTSGVKTSDTHAQILDITKIEGLPGDTFKITAKFSSLSMRLIGKYNTQGGTGSSIPPIGDQIEISFRIYFGGDDARQSSSYSEVKQQYATNLFSYSTPAFASPLPASFFFTTVTLNFTPIIEFTVRIPNVNAGIYNLWTSAELDKETGPTAQLGRDTTPIGAGATLYEQWISNKYYLDDASNAKVLFFVNSVSEVLVSRGNLYAPQLKAACVSGEKLIGGRVYDGKAYIEVYQQQNGAVDRTLQINLTADTSIPAPPTYMALIASNDVIVAAFDNLIYKIDIATSGLTDAQRITAIGTVPGTYVSGMEIWNQRVYIGSFDKSKFTSAISWSNLTVIERSYAIDGKFWITDLATFNGALFYSGGTQDGAGQVRAFPSDIILEFKHPQFDNRVRTLNAGRKLYAGWSHGTGIGIVTERGASSWAKTDLGEEAGNVVWDIEEVGDTVFMLADSGFFKTTPRFVPEGSLETSEIGGNTPLIDKDWYTVKIELKTPIAGDDSVKIWAANSTSPDTFNLIGQILTTDGAPTEREFSFPPNFSSQWVKLLIELTSGDGSTTPIIKRVSVKYVPSSLQKLQWAFGVRAYSNIKLLNGSHESRNGTEIMSDVFDLRTRGRITFRDIDDEIYDVTITNIKQTNPVVDKKNLEGLIVVELLEL